ncbi:MAG: hypothetical protein HW375_23 [Anaerolineales bacterium]|nr:hypothetical protein [Anaerolineales bacterium]
MAKGTGGSRSAATATPARAVEVLRVMPAPVGPQIVISVNVTVAPKHTPNAAAVVEYVRKLEAALAVGTVEQGNSGTGSAG